MKAIAIIAVVLYHIGTCDYGYLGVDVFLVIAGYFTSQSIDKQIINRGGYFRFVTNRLFRLWPLLLLAGVVCLGFGWLMMLPDNFENVAQSVVATNFFGNNVLAAITTKNYWDVSNDYKPLMHTWYVGVIMQFYVIIPLLLFAVGKWSKNADRRKHANIVLVSLIGVASLVAYLTCENAAMKFYYLPFRLYEFCAGCTVFYLFGNKSGSASKRLLANIGFVVAYLAVIALLFVDAEYMSRPAKLLSTVCLTSVLLMAMPQVEWAQDRIFSNKWVATIGAASFSIFVWHQVVIAFTRYSFTNNLEEFVPFVSVVILTAILAIPSYKYVEKMKKNRAAWIVTVVVLFLTTGFSLYIYETAGVIRDVPELDVVKGKIHRGMWAEYCDRGYQYDKDFSGTDKPKWYVIGNSFGRDMVNIILESPVADSVEISYSTQEAYKKRGDRFAEADVVFLSTLGVNDDIIRDVKSRCSERSKFYIIGEKNFGESNGQVYRHRLEKKYHDLTIKMEEGYAEKNDILKRAYSDTYIDLIKMVQQPDGKVRVFSDDNRFISQDCRHLTKAGAQYYAKMMNWDKFLMKR